jgi:hypothetical protein
MKKKLLAILVCMLMITSTTIFIAPEYLQVKAAGEGSGGGSENGVGISTSFIHSTTENLSYIVKTYLKGRSFGTPGEGVAAQYIETWMNQIGLYNVHPDEITGTAQHPDLNSTVEILPKGKKLTESKRLQIVISAQDGTQRSYPFSILVMQKIQET